VPGEVRQGRERVAQFLLDPSGPGRIPPVTQYQLAVQLAQLLVKLGTDLGWGLQVEA
jgi:hypothetical protein